MDLQAFKLQASMRKYLSPQKLEYMTMSPDYPEKAIVENAWEPDHGQSTNPCSIESFGPPL